MAVKKGNKIKVTYEGRFEDGEVFDSCQKHGGKPLEFTVGEKMVVPGFDNAVIGMNVGEEKEVVLKPKEAYGESNPQAIQRIPKRMMPGDVEEGTEIEVPLENGQSVPAKIIRIVSDLVTIDLNHPLAGKTLIFKIKLEEII